MSIKLKILGESFVLVCYRENFVDTFDMNKIIRFLKNFLILVFVIILFLAYYELTERFAPVTLYRDKFGHSIASTDPNTYFYTFFAFFIVINLLISMIAKITKQFPLEKIRLPQRDFWKQDKAHIQSLHIVFEAWIYGFALIINTFMIILAAKIWFVNRSIGGQLWEYGLMALTLIIILLIWIGFIFYRLSIKREEYIT